MINWHAIDAVLFDMDGTLLDLHYDNYFWNCHLPQHYAALHQLPVAEAVDLLLEKYDRELVAVYLTAFNASNENRWKNLDTMLADDERLQFHA